MKVCTIKLDTPENDLNILKHKANSTSAVHIKSYKLTIETSNLQPLYFSCAILPISSNQRFPDPRVFFITQIYLLAASKPLELFQDVVSAVYTIG